MIQSVTFFFFFLMKVLICRGVVLMILLSRTKEYFLFLFFPSFLLFFNESIDMRGWEFVFFSRSGGCGLHCKYRSIGVGIFMFLLMK